jgi:hypothetical protein
MYKIFSFRPRDFIFPYKRAAYQAPATTISTPPSDDPAGEDPSNPPPPRSGSASSRATEPRPLPPRVRYVQTQQDTVPIATLLGSFLAYK